MASARGVRTDAELRLHRVRAWSTDDQANAALHRPRLRRPAEPRSWAVTKELMMVPSSRSARLMFAVLCCIFIQACDSLRRPSIVGQWRSDANSSDTVEFFPDGTMREMALLKNTNGKYVLLDDDRVKTETDGLLWGTNVATWTYSIKGDKLTMTTEGGVGITLNWTRVK